MPHPSKDVAIVAGASGVVGSRLVEALVDTARFHVIGCARRLPASRTAGADYAAVDLTNAEACRQFAARVPGITHLFYTARAEFITGQDESSDINTMMFRNLLDAVEASSPELHHVHMVHGTKYYGSTDGPFPTPARENEPRRARRNFYYAQEDVVMARTSRRWSWSASRPHCVCDSTLATPRSLPSLIATYAAICQHRGEPLSFPGTPGNYRAIYQCTDAKLLARAIVWMATEPRCADQAFNVTNGDVFRWESVWPEFARYFGLACGPIRTITMADEMPRQASTWEDIVAKNGLVATPYEQMALWRYGDFIFTPDWDMEISMTKLRQFGFHETLDSQQMFLEFFDDFSRREIIPAAKVMG